MTDVREDRDPERDVVQAVRVVEEVADPAGRVAVDAADPGEAGDVRHLAERVGGDHRVGEGDHQEVDAGAPGRDRAADQPDHRGEDDREDQGDGRVPAEMEPFRRPAGAALGRHVPDDDPRDPEQRRLRERDHAAVGRRKMRLAAAIPKMKVSSRIVWLQYELKPAAGQTARAGAPRRRSPARSAGAGSRSSGSSVLPEEAARPEGQDERDQDECQDHRVLRAAVRAGRGRYERRSSRRRRRGSRPQPPRRSTPSRRRSRPRASSGATGRPARTRCSTARPRRPRRALRARSRRRTRSRTSSGC